MNDYGMIIEPGTLRIQRLLPGPIERVWAYLTESDKRATWLAAGAMTLENGAPLELEFRNSDLSGEHEPRRPSTNSTAAALATAATSPACSRRAC